MTEKQKVADTLKSPELSRATEELFNDLLVHEPKPVENFVPANAAEQKELFLSGAIYKPMHNYSKLDSIDFEAMHEGISSLTQSIIDTIPDDPLSSRVYEDFGLRYLKLTQFMELASQINHEEDATERQKLSDRYMQLNIELYGEPDESVYRSFINDTLNVLRTKDLSGRAGEVYSELLELVPRTASDLDAERFRPSSETIEWTGKVVEALYSGLLSHVPEDKESFQDTEIAEIFRSIVEEEFRDSESGANAADDWTVAVEKAQSVNVVATQKKIIIPEGRELSRAALRGLIVHEIGVHMLRSLTGEQTTLTPMRLGLAGYYDSEEGLAVVMHQALVGEYREAGESPYITAGLAYFDKKDFREAFEIQWRMKALKKLKDGEVLDEDAVNKARVLSYNSMMRSFRGTDTIPWFRGLSYYNGTNGVWKYLEDHRGDDLYLSLLLAGKADPSNDSHRRTLLESSSK